MVSAPLARVQRGQRRWEWFGDGGLVAPVIGRASDALHSHRRMVPVRKSPCAVPERALAQGADQLSICMNRSPIAVEICSSVPVVVWRDTPTAAALLSFVTTCGGGRWHVSQSSPICSRVYSETEKGAAHRIQSSPSPVRRVLGAPPPTPRLSRWQAVRLQRGAAQPWTWAMAGACSRATDHRRSKHS